MLTTTFLAAVTGLASLALAASDAPTTLNNPTGLVYQAILPDRNQTTIRGYITGTAGTNGTGITFNVNFYGLPVADRGPLIYHIHENALSDDGNCSSAGAHLDPYVRGDSTPCDSTNPAQCQLGDLSGKHGNITRSPFQTTYLDPYISSLTDVNAFFGNRSVVIHASNVTRLTCANFTIIAGTATNSSSAPLATTTTTSGAAVTGAVSVAAVLAGLVALFL